jgi:hypothetical protein
MARQLAHNQCGRLRPISATTSPLLAQGDLVAVALGIVQQEPGEGVVDRDVG